MLSKESKLSKRTSARIITVQSMYSYEFLNAVDVEEALREAKSEEDYPISKYDNTLLEALIENIKEHCDSFDEIISRHLDENWTLQRIETVILIILRAAACELIYFPDTSTNIIINEYTTITSYFANTKEVNFVNAILEKISANIRAEVAK